MNRYSKTVHDRIEIYSVLHEQVKNDYTEQTPMGNVYNSFDEFVLANDVITNFVHQNDQVALNVLKGGINVTFDETIKYIEEYPL